jgi:internalin A
MTDNKNVPKIIENSGLALHKTRNLLSITDKILASKTVAVTDDAWLDELIAWADENEFSQREFPRDKKDILEMTELGLYAIGLTEISESIGKLTNLTKLYLSHNQLTKVPESIGNLTNLTTLYLDRNQLVELPESIGNLTNLTGLYLGVNQFSKIPKSIGKLTKLTKLDLRCNPIKSLPLELTHLNSITNFINYY